MKTKMITLRPTSWRTDHDDPSSFPRGGLRTPDGIRAEWECPAGWMVAGVYVVGNEFLIVRIDQDQHPR